MAEDSKPKQDDPMRQRLLEGFCPCCGGKVVEEKQKLRCERCKTIVETCCS